jgi:CRISPR type I-E-associated protein CasB/Cse2
MTERTFDPQEAASALMSHLRRLQKDRGAMADLRCALNPVRRARAWPLLGQLGRHAIGDPRYETVAGLFAYHPDETHDGNLGTTCRRLASENNSFDGRFRRLLSCEREELRERLRPVILAAKAKGIPVNYDRLFIHLVYWGDNVKAQWAREYWGAPAEAEEAAS